MKKLILWLLMASFSVCIVTCARNPATGRREIVLVSESEEMAMGQATDSQTRDDYGVVDDARLQSYVQGLGRKLASVSHRPNLDWHFTVVDSPVINAFALPGGYIYLTRGILAYLANEAELAGVLGHEIAHVTARHSVQQITREELAQIGLGVGGILSPTFARFGGLAQDSLGLLFLRFSRDNEREADRLGVEYAARLGYDPREVSNFFEVLGRMSAAADRETIPGWLSTHPDPPERVQATRTLGEEWIRNLGLTPERMKINRETHLGNIDGIVFGDDPRSGFAEGARFFHPSLEFQILFPQGWRIDNTRAAVLAIDSQRAAQLQLSIAKTPPGTSAPDYARLLAQQGMVPRRGGETRINGYPAFLGYYSQPTENGIVAIVAAFIEYKQRLYEIWGATTDIERYGDRLEESIKSFESLEERRVLSAQPDRLKLYFAKQDDNLSAIAARLNNPRVNADQLAILNRLAIGAAITPGRQIKVIERGY